jgi:hypothetical protein
MGSRPLFWDLTYFISPTRPGTIKNLIFCLVLAIGGANPLYKLRSWAYPPAILPKKNRLLYFRGVRPRNKPNQIPCRHLVIARHFGGFFNRPDCNCNCSGRFTLKPLPSSTSGLNYSLLGLLESSKHNSFSRRGRWTTGVVVVTEILYSSIITCIYCVLYRMLSAVKHPGVRNESKSLIYIYIYIYYIYDISGVHSRSTPGVFYTYFYNHAHRLRLEKLL